MFTSSLIYETAHITRIAMKSGNIKTCVFLINNGKDYTLIDCGFNEYNILNQLLPALKDLNVPIDKIRRLFLTHRHNDHIGGLQTLLNYIPNIEVYAHKNISQHMHSLYDGLIIDSLQSIYLPGHTLDCFGFLDLRTNSLISGDALQLWGIEKYGVCAESPIDYLNSHNKLLSLPIENIFSSHAYDFYGLRAIGVDACKAYIQESTNNYMELISFVKKWTIQGKTSEEICSLFESEHPNYPKMQPYAVDKIIIAFHLKST